MARKNQISTDRKNIKISSLPGFYCHTFISERTFLETSGITRSLFFYITSLKKPGVSDYIERKSKQMVTAARNWLAESRHCPLEADILRLVFNMVMPCERKSKTTKGPSPLYTYSRYKDSSCCTVTATHPHTPTKYTKRTS